MAKNEQQLKIINNIHVLRAEKRITQEELAKAVGVTRGTIIAIEGGGYNPSLELVFKISRYFGTEIDKIFTVEGGKK